MADLILVLDRGRLSEMGTHAELMAAGASYARMYESQERAYS
jgi:ABC-type multidrug transport system fused ATPase/permease subunit